MFDKIWAHHVVTEGPGGLTLLYVDRHLLHEGSAAAFTRLRRSGRTVRRPDLCVATADHYVMTSPGTPAADAEVAAMIESLATHTGEAGIVHFGRGDARTEAIQQFLRESDPAGPLDFLRKKSS